MANKRELIEPNKGDKRYVRRDSEGRFRCPKESEDRPQRRVRRKG